MGFTVQREDEGEGVLGHSVRRIARYTRHGDAQLLGGLQIHIVESRTTQRNEPDARTCEAFEDFTVHDVVDKHADRLHPWLRRRFRLLTGSRETANPVHPLRRHGQADAG